ncbi:MAG: DUF4838 domain-containing protein, partial [Candidatus Methanomethylophilaceae archaeon]|nr:DUF4838 domain-containing protein [Candidatus Methanomethylophilaceae archaeon]
SLIVCSPASLPALAELFPEDLAWLADIGDPDAGARWGSDGFAIRTLGKDIYIFGNVTRGTLNGVYDWIEENLGVLWLRADEELGLLYDEQPEVTILKTDYREKSPFFIRGWAHSRATWETSVMWSRNKLNWLEAYPYFTCPVGGYLKSLLTDSPLYDPEETEYWNTDEEGNRLTVETSPQVNFYSEKVIDLCAAACLEQLDHGYPCAFVGEEDTAEHPYNRPDDTEPFEYAPGQFVNPEDEDYLSTVFFTFINKIARKVKEQNPDGKVGTYAYFLGIVPPRCGIEDNVYIWLAPINEDMCYPLLSQETKAKNLKGPTAVVRFYCDYVAGWSGKSDHIEVYNYYGISRAQHQVTIPIWERMQTDLQDYVRLRFDGVSAEGVVDGPGLYSFDDLKDPQFPYHSWTMNGLLLWLYSKLAWNPYEDVEALIQLYCDRFYGAASAPMQEYYHLMKQGWDETRVNFKQAIFYYTHHTEYYTGFVKKSGLARQAFDALEEALEAASGPVRDEIQYMRDTFFFNINSFRKW